MAAACLATDMGAEVAIAGCSLEKRIQAEQELGQAQTIVMNITDEGTVEQGMAGPSQVDHGPISAGTMRNRARAPRWRWPMMGVAGVHVIHGLYCVLKSCGLRHER